MSHQSRLVLAGLVSTQGIAWQRLRGLASFTEMWGCQPALPFTHTASHSHFAVLLAASNEESHSGAIGFSGQQRQVEISHGVYICCCYARRMKRGMNAVWMLWQVCSVVMRGYSADHQKPALTLTRTLPLFITAGTRGADLIYCHKIY